MDAWERAWKAGWVAGKLDQEEVSTTESIQDYALRDRLWANITYNGYNRLKPTTLKDVKTV
jgi:hypothetical protein